MLLTLLDSFNSCTTFNRQCVWTKLSSLSQHTCVHSFHLCNLFRSSLNSCCWEGTGFVLLLGAYPRQDVAAQMSLRNCFRSSATLLAAVIVPNVSVMSFSHLCLGFPRLLFPATIPCIIVFSKPLCRVTWPKYLSFCRLTKLYIQFVGR